MNPYESRSRIRLELERRVSQTGEDLDVDRIEQAIWEGDMDFLCEHMRCICCCDEHTFDWCPARVWNGCRGQGAMTRQDVESWARHYGMTLSEFYGEQA